jgi:hypothetical protein
MRPLSRSRNCTLCSMASAPVITNDLMEGDDPGDEVGEGVGTSTMVRLICSRGKE